jgi:hypothetical protein
MPPGTNGTPVQYIQRGQLYRWERLWLVIPLRQYIQYVYIVYIVLIYSEYQVVSLLLIRCWWNTVHWCFGIAFNCPFEALVEHHDGPRSLLVQSKSPCTRDETPSGRGCATDGAGLRSRVSREAFHLNTHCTRHIPYVFVCTQYIERDL